MSVSLRSINSSINSSLKNMETVLRNDNLTSFVLLLTIALSVGYLVNKTYHALVILYVIAALMFLLCKNVAGALGISIILTNLLLSLNIINTKENFEVDKKDIINIMKKSNKKEKKKKE
tara:strand:+ start:1386 stop:1742 length:357 start_codon:yes stop_codon:yes gene_type:complete